MPKETMTYSNKDITVTWKPGSCIHSKLCWQGLIEVFNPRERPWIKMEGATTEQIIEQIKKCPSGALSYKLNDKAEETGDPVKMESVPETLKIEVAPNGPYLVGTSCTIIHHDGREETREGTVALCRCGQSANKPFCDGQHRKVGFKD
jgi:uncharacterized Fe-S cluster protein YjdI